MKNRIQVSIGRLSMSAKQNRTPEDRKDRDERSAERSRPVRIFPAQDDHAGANQREGEERSDIREIG